MYAKCIMDQTTSYSQAGQDIFVFHMLGRKTDGVYLEMGTEHPTHISNSMALERLGWTGVSLDINPDCGGFCKVRKNPLVVRDATNCDWEELRRLFPCLQAPVIDYMSFDVDEASLAALHNMPLDKMRFKIITAEHDRYRLGDEPMIRMREILSKHGYVAVCENVFLHGNIDYEDWWVDPAYFDTALLDKIRCKGKNYRDIVRAVTS